MATSPISWLNDVAAHDYESAYNQKPGADIADGYHRGSLAYNIDPFMSVPLRLG